MSAPGGSAPRGVSAPRGAWSGGCLVGGVPGLGGVVFWFGGLLVWSSGLVASWFGAF